MIVSSLDTNVALPNRFTIVEEQRNYAFVEWTFYIYPFIPLLIKYSPWEWYRLDKGGAGREELRTAIHWHVCMV